MLMVLEAELVEAIAVIGRYRSPAEACGLLLPVIVKGRQVLELPNRSKQPLDSFEMLGSDMMMELEKLLPWEMLEKMVEDGSITAWHTHPSGNVGPSRFDLKNKAPKLNNLVVTLFEDGKRPLATWY